MFLSCCSSSSSPLFIMRLPQWSMSSTWKPIWSSKTLETNWNNLWNVSWLIIWPLQGQWSIFAGWRIDCDQQVCQWSYINSASRPTCMTRKTRDTGATCVSRQAFYKCSRTTYQDTCYIWKIVVGVLKYQTMLQKWLIWKPLKSHFSDWCHKWSFSAD